MHSEVEAILSYRPLKVHTEASTLKYLTMMKNQSGLFTRWYQELAGFNCTVVHKKGEENCSTILEVNPRFKVGFIKFRIRRILITTYLTLI